MNINNKNKIFLVSASLLMVLAISFGAFGAHALKAILSEPMMKIYNTGVQYQFYNVFGLFVASFLISLKPDSKKLYIATWLILIGMLIFSFSLYLLVLLNLPILGAITPIGGTLLIIGWLIISYSIYKN